MCGGSGRQRRGMLALGLATLLASALCTAASPARDGSQARPPAGTSTPLFPGMRKAKKIAASVAECRTSDLAVSIRWKRSKGGLQGHVLAENIGHRTCRVGAKPVVVPTGVDGQPLRVENVQTTELRVPGFVVLNPGQRGAAPVGWFSWCGTPASGRALVAWDGGSTVATVIGPSTPACVAQIPQNLSTRWFSLV